jgi:hypothetical protein
MAAQVELERPSSRSSTRDRAMAIVSACTAIWLVLQVGAALSTSSDGWPISGVPMYADARTSWSERDLQVTTESGQTFRLRMDHLDLRGFELHSWVRDHVGDSEPEPGAPAALGRLAVAYNRANPDDPAVRLVHHVTVRSLDDGRRVIDEYTVEWEAA